MDKVLDEIKSTMTVYGEYLHHDPVDPELQYDFIRRIYKPPERNYMPFVKPILIESSQFSYIFNSYVTLTSHLSKSYFRPIEFYDHFLTPTEINNLSTKELYDFAVYNISTNNFATACIYASIYLLKIQGFQADIYKVIQLFHKQGVYKIFTELNDNESYFKRDIIFDESWNTIFYYLTFVPRRKKYFINYKKLTCSCAGFRRDLWCSHLYKIMSRKVLMNEYNNISIVNHLLPCIMSQFQL
jgi:hypothetical protein